MIMHLASTYQHLWKTQHSPPIKGWWPNALPDMQGFKHHNLPIPNAGGGGGAVVDANPIIGHHWDDAPPPQPQASSPTARFINK